MTTDPTPRPVLADWRDQLDGRQIMQLAWAELYAREFAHGATGHNDMRLLARLAEMLDIAAGVREPPAPVAADDLMLEFGKYRGMTLRQVLREDRSYIEWLAREGRDQEARQAAAAVLRGPVLPLPFDDAPPAAAASAEEGELPF